MKPRVSSFGFLALIAALTTALITVLIIHLFAFEVTAAQITVYVSAVVVEAATPPELTVPPDITVECSDEAATDLDNTGWTTATTNCANNANNGSNPVITFKDTLLSGTCPQERVITRIWTATDDCANSAASAQIITVMDTKAPNIHNLTADPDLLWPLNHKMIPVVITCESHDNCDPSSKCRIISVESNQPLDACGDGDTEADWEITSDLTVNLRAEKASCMKEDRIYTITVECTDCKGNGSSQTVEVKVTHDSR